MYNYFPHPSTFRTMDAVLSMRIEEGAAGYGVYMMLLELLRDAEGCMLKNNPRHLAFAINEPDVTLVDRVINKYNLFDLNDQGQFSSPWLTAAMEQYQAVKAAAAEAGKRGAAKRWGTKQESSTPNSTPLGGGMATLSQPDSNITNNTNQQNIPTNSRSKLLGLSWADWSGEQLYKLSRFESVVVDARCVQECDDTNDRQHNKGAVARFCQQLGCTVAVLRFLLEWTHEGLIGSTELVKLIALGAKCKKDSFVPKYPNEYVLTKLLSSDPIQ